MRCARPFTGILAATALILLSGGPFAAAFAQSTGWDENVQGDLSNDRFAPTRIVLGLGAPGVNGLTGNNIVTGRTGRAGSVIDRDYFTAVVPAGLVLTEVRLGNQATVGGNGSFLGMAFGAVMPVAPDAANAVGLAGALVYGTAMRGTDILDDLGAGWNGASGFARPLGAGEYTFWVQETAPGSFTHRFNLVVSPVPAPTAVWLFLAGLPLLGWARARALSASVTQA
ncbi:MAG: hypothetical protein ACKVQQ_04485 [Burkholderiales bacterium]